MQKWWLNKAIMMFSAHYVLKTKLTKILDGLSQYLAETMNLVKDIVQLPYFSWFPWGHPKGSQCMSDRKKKHVLDNLLYYLLQIYPFTRLLSRTWTVWMRRIPFVSKDLQRPWKFPWEVGQLSLCKYLAGWTRVTITNSVLLSGPCHTSLLWITLLIV